MEEHEGLQYLISETHSLLRRQGSPLLLHVLLEVVFKVLEHQVELLLREQYLFQPIQFADKC